MGEHRPFSQEGKSRVDLPSVYRAVVSEEITPEDFKVIVNAVKNKAKRGVRWAVRDAMDLVIAFLSAETVGDATAGKVIVLRGGQADSREDVERRVKEGG